MAKLSFRGLQQAMGMTKHEGSEDVILLGIPEAGGVVEGGLHSVRTYLQ